MFRVTWYYCSLSPPRSCWSLRPHPPHYLIHKARAFIPQLCLLVQFLCLFVHWSLQQSLMLQAKPVFTSPAPALHYFAAQSTHLRLAVPGSDQLMRVPQSSAVAASSQPVPGCCWGGLSSSPTLPGCLGAGKLCPAQSADAKCCEFDS